MKHPFWLVNSFLLLLLVMVFGFIFFSQQRKPKKIPFISDEPIKPIKKILPKIDPSKIYLNDLFGTYQTPAPQPSISDSLKPLPQPPAQKKPKIVVKPIPKFLDPLPISLRGIMIIGDENDYVVMIEDTKTKQSHNHKVGDKIKDAQLIRIMRNKIILLRSNGQQETLFLSKYDAEIEELLSVNQKWHSVIRKNEEYVYSVDPDAFVIRVRNLAHLIDMLNLTTVYKKGKSIGNRVGRLKKDSIGVALGLRTGDIITKVNDINTTDTDNRFAIYKQIINMKQGDVITINLMRRKMPMTITYTIQPIDREAAVEETEKALHIPKTPREIQKEKIKVMQDKNKFARQAQQLKREKKRRMLVDANPKNNKFVRKNRQQNALTQ